MNKNKIKFDANVFYNAAMLLSVDKNDCEKCYDRNGHYPYNFSCNAIRGILFDKNKSHNQEELKFYKTLYSQWFTPDNIEMGSIKCWWDSEDYFTDQLCRSIALLLMYEIVKEGEYTYEIE